MKRTVTAVLLGCLAVFSGLAQDIKEPEFPDVVYALDAGKLVQLERQEAGSQAGRAGLVGAKAAMEIPGPQSPVRLPSGHQLDFIVKSPASLESDPGSLYHFRKARSRKQSREIVLITASPFRAKKTTENLIPFAFSKYGTSSLRLTVGPLEPGEYAVGRQRGQVLFCFGVD
jgi:hypothetical protein